MLSGCIVIGLHYSRQVRRWERWDHGLFSRQDDSLTNTTACPLRALTQAFFISESTNGHGFACDVHVNCWRVKGNAGKVFESGSVSSKD